MLESGREGRGVLPAACERERVWGLRVREGRVRLCLFCACFFLCYMTSGWSCVLCSVCVCRKSGARLGGGRDETERTEEAGRVRAFFLDEKSSVSHGPALSPHHISHPSHVGRTPGAHGRGGFMKGKKACRATRAAQKKLGCVNRFPSSPPILPPARLHFFTGVRPDRRTGPGEDGLLALAGVVLAGALRAGVAW